MGSFSEGRFDAGVSFLIAGGHTGQTTEVLALPSDPCGDRSTPDQFGRAIPHVRHQREHVHRVADFGVAAVAVGNVVGELSKYPVGLEPICSIWEDDND